MARPEVRVRMYKRLLGDCFLIMVKQGAKQSNLLIDCGVLQGVSGAKAMMQEVAKDIVETTKGVLHMLAVTHEHEDHISGFSHARDTFVDAGGPLVVERVWMAWTEKPDDQQAKELRKRFEKSKVAVTAAASLAKLRMGDDAALPELDGLEDFIGPIGQGLAASKGRLTGHQTMIALKEKAGPGKVDYLEPGEVRMTPGPVPLRVYVLAPPRKPERLFTDLPSKEGHETYLNALNEQADTLAMNLGATAGTVDAASAGSPFSRRHRVLTVEVAKSLAAERNRGRAADDPARPLFAGYYHADNEARRIDHDWAGAAGALALKLDSDTNNGSLVLAFELGDTPGKGPVLLFAADAQVGNWLSWHDQTYPADAERNKAGVAAVGKVTAESLLNRTVLYKVGHHASHNATLREQGLEMMTDPALAAMIPVVSAVSDTKKGWEMPYVPLLERLVAKTGGRVMRGDCALGDGLQVEDGKILYNAPLPIEGKFAKRVKVQRAVNPATGQEDEFWVEYRVS